MLCCYVLEYKPYHISMRWWLAKSSLEILYSVVVSKHFIYFLSFFFSFLSKWNHKYIFKPFFRSTQDSDIPHQPELRGGSGQKYWSHVEIEKQASVRKLQNKERLFTTTETVSATEWDNQHYSVNFRKIMYLKYNTKLCLKYGWRQF